MNIKYIIEIYFNISHHFIEYLQIKFQKLILIHYLTITMSKSPLLLQPARACSIAESFFVLAKPIFQERSYQKFRNFIIISWSAL